MAQIGFFQIGTLLRSLGTAGHIARNRDNGKGVGNETKKASYANRTESGYRKSDLKYLSSYWALSDHRESDIKRIAGIG